MSNLSVNAITNAAGGNTATINGMTPTADSLQGFRNRIINGDMRIDQRNAGASVTAPAGSTTYFTDRWSILESTDGAVTGQQVTTAPSGFSNSLLVTVTSTDSSLTTTQQTIIQQKIEGFNTADLSFGTASAAPVTLSFWVRCSVTGTFAGSFRNSANDRSYPFTYTISSANTWEQKTVTVSGDTTGTWIGSTNGIGLEVIFSLGAGPDRTGTANAWAGSNFVSATGATNLMATSGATFYITGVQLEAGSVATPFERRPYGTELQLAQRYFEIVRFGGASKIFGTDSSQWISEDMRFLVEKRALPTVASVSGSWKWWNGTSQITANFTSYEIKTTTVAASGASGGPGQSNAGIGFSEPVLSVSAEL